MTRTDEFFGELEGYLDDYEGSTPLPEAVRDAIRAELPSTHQRPSWWPARRFPEMNTMAKLGIAAAVVVVALLGYSYFVVPNVGAPAPSDPAPTPTAEPSHPPPEDGQALNPGTYTLPLSSGTAEITVPAGWSGLGDFGVALAADEASQAYVVFWPANDFAVFDIYSDPCAWNTNVVEPRVGPSVDDLANALADQAMRGDAVPTDVTIDGFEGKYLEMSVPTDIDFADCAGGEFRSWEGRYHQGPGQVDRLYILDVDGEREVLIVNFMPGTSDAQLAEQQTVFESIDILP